MFTDLNFLQPYIPLLPIILPLLSASISGVLRQDGFPEKVNEAITIGIVLVAAVVMALYNKTLGNNPISDFVQLAAYMLVVVQHPYMKDFQGYLQGNVLSIIKDVASLPVS